MASIRPHIFFIAVAVILLNLADALFTQIILDHGGSEVNPLIRAALDRYGLACWLWKYLAVSLSVMILASQSHLQLARVSLGICAVLYGSVTCWHLLLLNALPLSY